MEKKKQSFDDIRVICCFIVIYEHCVVLTDISYISIGLRSAAVNVFFVLSGFWVTRSFVRSRSLLTYAKKRFQKIFPFLWGVVLTCAVTFSVFSTLGIKKYFLSPMLYKYIICNCLTLNFLCQGLPGVFVNTYANGAINGALWTLKIEIGFYILLPIIYLIYNKWKGSKRKLCIFIFIISLVVSTIISIIVDCFSLPKSLNGQLPTYLPYFLFGMCLALDDGICNYIRKSKLLFSISLVLFALGRAFYSDIATYFEPVFIGIIIFFLAYNVPSFIGKREDLSYGMYLIHFPIIQMLAWLGMFRKYPFVGIIAVFCITYTIIKLVNFLKYKCAIMA